MTDDQATHDDAHTPTVRLDTDARPGAIEVTVDGDPFTTYAYDGPPALTKPVLWPLRSASGRSVTRGYPLDPGPGERVDHPHHVGHWLNYDPVDGVNFWANAGPDTPEEFEPLGSVELREIHRAEGGRGQNGHGRGTLAVTADWVGPDGPVLCEDTRFEFRATADRRVVDRITTLTAVDGPVSFADSKEGTFALRVASALEHPPEESITVVDDPAAGTTTEVDPGRDDPDDTAVGDGEVDRASRRTGEYLSSARVRGRDVWGTRAAWMRLSGELDDSAVAVTVFDHPENVGYPTYWMARGYGLFAANPFGQAVYSDGEERLDFELDAGASTTLRYRIAVDEDVPGPTELDDRAEAFAGRYRTDRTGRD